MASWSATTNRSTTSDGTISTPIWTVSHTQGTATYAVGNQQYVAAQGYTGPTGVLNNWVNINNTIYDYNINSYILSPTAYINGVNLPYLSSIPYWIHLDFPAIRSAYRCYTNITPQQFTSGYITAFSQASYRTTFGFGGDIGTVLNNDPGGNLVFDSSPGGDISIVPAGGTVNNPLQIGDSNTLYGSQLINTTGFGSYRQIAGQIGTATSITAPDVYSNFYSTFNLEIRSDMPTGTYQFRFELDWNYL